MFKRKTIFDYIELEADELLEQTENHQKELELLDPTLAKKSRIRSLVHNPAIHINGCTLTFRNRWHLLDPKLLRYEYSNYIISLLAKTKATVAIELYCGFGTKNKLFHMHGVIYSSSDYVMSKYFARHRALWGFVKTESIRNAVNWLSYSEKHNSLRPIYYLKGKDIPDPE